jgi:hypothetical protein
VLFDDAPLELPVLFESALALGQPLPAATRDYERIRGQLSLEKPPAASSTLPGRARTVAGG